MRSILIGLSLIFFTLSAMITFKALDLPARPPLTHTPLADSSLTDAPLTHAPSYQDTQKDAVSESNGTAKNLTETQDIDSAIVTDLMATIAQLEDKLRTTEKTIENIKAESIKTVDAENQPRTLAVFSGRTFRPGHDVINEAAASKIEKLVNEISVFPDSHILIEGHTDNIPTGKLHSDNTDLSLRRAKTIANLLISKGIPRERISVNGYGDTRPIDTNSTEEGRARNRRVEVKLMLKQGGD